MGPSFIACDREQSFLMPPDVREWLPQDHFAWFVIEAVAAMDLDAFYAVYRGDGRARPAYEPAMMVALLVYGAPGLTGMEKEMRALYIEGVAIRGGPESCVGVREGVGEALTGARVAWAIEPRNES